MKHTSRTAFYVSDIHGHIMFLFYMPYWYSSTNESFFKCKTASEQESHHVFCPVILDVSKFPFQLAFLIYSVFWQIARDICSRCNKFRLRVSRFCNIQQRTGFWIPLAKDQEIQGIVHWQHNKIRLSITRALS